MRVPCLFDNEILTWIVYFLCSCTAYIFIYVDMDSQVKMRDEMMKTLCSESALSAILLPFDYTKESHEGIFV